MKICLISARYSFTGVALAQARLARAFARAGHEVDLIYGCLDADLLPPEYFKIPKVHGVFVQVWGCNKARSMLWPTVKYLRIAKPDIVLSAEDHMNGLVLLAAMISGSRARIGGSSRVSPFDSYSNKILTKNWLFKYLSLSVWWRAKALTCVSEDMVHEYRSLFPNGKHTCVYNVIVDQESLKRAREPVDHPWFQDRDTPLIIAAGTLTIRKGFGDLVNAVGILRLRGRVVRLVILGDGPLREELTARATELGFGDSLWLPGKVANPLKYFARADVFALSSLAEGLPNVLVEAMMCGCTPVATDCPTGPREVLKDGQYGYLVPVKDPEALADGIIQALEHPIPPDRLAEAVLPFEESAVLNRHFETLSLAAST